MATVIPKGSRVLVTGATGFIAAHVVEQLLQTGYKVRGTIRDANKAKFLHDRFGTHLTTGDLELVSVPDMTAPNAYQSAVEGVSGIIHIASVTTFSDKFDEVVGPAIAGTTNIVESAKQEASVKSVVLTSSTVAVARLDPENDAAITEQSWNDQAVKHARETGANGTIVYMASKNEAEHAFWTAVQGASFQASAVLPSANFGEFLGPTPAVTDSWIPKLYQGITDGVFPHSYFVNVRDSARLHVAALIDPSANGRRLPGVAGAYNINAILASLRKQYPQKSFIDDIEDLPIEKAAFASRNDADALLQKHFGSGFVGLDESVKENLDRWLAVAA